MKIATKRVLRVETSLTPKQAVLRWLEEAHSVDSVIDYAGWLQAQGINAYPW